MIKIPKQIAFYIVSFSVSMAGIVVATLLLLSIGPQSILTRTGLLTVFILGCIILLYTFCRMTVCIRMIWHNQIDLQSKYSRIKQDISQRVARLQEQNEVLSLRNSQLQKIIKDGEYPLEKGLKSLLLL